MHVAHLGLLFLAFAPKGQGTQNQPDRRPTITGKVVKIEGFESKTLGNKRDVVVWLPPGYEAETRRRYPVLYLHDGQNVFDGATSFIAGMEWRADEAAQGLIESKLTEPFIMVAIANAGAARGDEYLPTRARMGDSFVGGKAMLYTKMVVDELKPRIDREFRTQPDAKHTAVCGSSFGGIVSLYMALTRPDVFGMAAVVSPSIWWDGKVILKQISALKSKPPVVLWVDMGGSEGGRSIEDARELKAALVAKGWRLGRDLAYFEDGLAMHNELAWSRRIGMILMWFFGNH